MLLMISQSVLYAQPQDKILPDPSLKNSCNSLKQLICFYPRDIVTHVKWQELLACSLFMEKH